MELVIKVNLSIMNHLVNFLSLVIHVEEGFSVWLIGIEHSCFQVVLLDSELSCLNAFIGESCLSLDEAAFGGRDLMLKTLEILLNLGHQCLDLVFFMGNYVLELSFNLSGLSSNLFKSFHKLVEGGHLVVEVAYE